MGPLVVFMADTGARPAEVVAVEHRHVYGALVEFAGHEDGARVAVGAHDSPRHGGCRGDAARPRDAPRLPRRRASHLVGLLLAGGVAAGAEAAGLEYRAPYN